MAYLEERDILVGKIAKLQGQQLTTLQEAKLHGWNSEQSGLAFDTRVARIGSLMRQLIALDEGEREP